MKILTASLCKQGGRDYNQDYVAQYVDDNAVCLVVCDGLGSYVGSEVASRLCGTKIIDTFKQILEYDATRAFNPEFVQSYVQTAHNYVVDYKEQNPKIKSSCTTVSCIVTDLNTTTISHIGDTRVYFFKDNTLHFQTRDHSLAQMAVNMGEISSREIRNHKDQNKLTRVLGSDYYIAPDCDIERKPLEVGDAFILCTDGFWEYVFEEEMETDLKSSVTPGEALTKMEARLLRRVDGHNDNYSAIVAMVVE